MNKVKKLKWTYHRSENIEYHYGTIGKTLYFEAVRFKDDNWILTSKITPMPMMFPEDIETCKTLSQSMLEGFIQYLTEE